MVTACAHGMLRHCEAAGMSTSFACDLLPALEVDSKHSDNRDLCFGTLLDPPRISETLLES